MYIEKWSGGILAGINGRIGQLYEELEMHAVEIYISPHAYEECQKCSIIYKGAARFQREVGSADAQ